MNDGIFIDKLNFIFLTLFVYSILNTKTNFKKGALKFVQESIAYEITMIIAEHNFKRIVFFSSKFHTNLFFIL